MQQEIGVSALDGDAGRDTLSKIASTSLACCVRGECNKQIASCNQKMNSLFSNRTIIFEMFLHGYIIDVDMLHLRCRGGVYAGPSGELTHVEKTDYQACSLGFPTGFPNLGP